MNSAEIEFVLEIESQIESCLRLIRRYRQFEFSIYKKPKITQLMIAEEVLMNYERPLHVKEIVRLANMSHKKQLKVNSLVSALSKSAKEGKIFKKTGKNEFGLICMP